MSERGIVIGCMRVTSERGTAIGFVRPTSERGIVIGCVRPMSERGIVAGSVRPARICVCESCQCLSVCRCPSGVSVSAGRRMSVDP